ncbi:hypothetical protein ACNKHU_16385 [Shigella flexneri]
MIAADGVDEYNKPDLSHVIVRGDVPTTLPARRRVIAEQFNLPCSATWGNGYRCRSPCGEKPE